ncbi:hypothetical protein B0H14DRAFT_2674713 [Mycena olivaceomarginata]|nr:hypothetical protein B0H14DRAFT_2674713 [Mycena olivaceomarginata]
MLRIIVDRQTVYPVLSDFLPVLWDDLGGVAAHARIVEAINAGFLQILIIGAASPHSDESARTDIEEMLKSFLPGFTTYQSVLECIRNALPEADVLASTPQFKASPIAKHRESFRTLVQQRTSVLESNFAAEFTSWQGCDGPDATDTRCCSGCRSVHYCSRGCQTADWRESEHDPMSGLHRLACPILRLSIPTGAHSSSSNLYPGVRGSPFRRRPFQLALNGSLHADPFTRRDRFFMQALVRCDYAQHRTEIIAKYRTAVAHQEDPHDLLSTFCVAVFDYTRGVLDISVRTWALSDELDTMAQAHDADEVLHQQIWVRAWAKDGRTREQLVWVHSRSRTFSTV